MQAFLWLAVGFLELYEGLRVACMLYRNTVLSPTPDDVIVFRTQFLQPFHCALATYFVAEILSVSIEKRYNGIDDK